MTPVEQSGPNDPYGLRAIVDAWRDEVPGRRPSYDDVAFKARDHGAPEGFVGSWLSKVISGGRPYDENLLAAIALALDHEPEELPHFRLALTRRLLDERTNGLEGALEALTYTDEAFQRHRNQLLHGPQAPDGGAVVLTDEAADIIVTDKEGNRIALIQVKALSAPHHGFAHFTSRSTVEFMTELVNGVKTGELVAVPGNHDITPTPSEAEANLRSTLRAEAQRTLEHPDTHPEAPSDEDSRETRG